MTGAFQVRRDTLVGFDGGDRIGVDVARPDKLRFWSDRDWPAMPAAISRGAGLSYTGASFGAGVVSIEHRDFDRLIAFDAASGQLTVEAGADLWTCQRFLIAHGHYLPCHPGHGRITIGGCVAGEVHGKNPWRDGGFSAQVCALTLLHPDHGLLTLDAATGGDLLALTCGGLGLTGHILTVTLKARPLRSPTLTVTRRRFATAADAFAALAVAARTADFAYSWHDLSIGGGGHLVMAASADGKAGVAATAAGEAPRLTPASERRLPFSLYNRLSLPVVNAAYRYTTRRFAKGARIGILDALFPVHASQLYFSLYGRRGFHEYQVLVPAADAAGFVAAVKTRADRHGVAVALCSGKAFGGDERFLRFAGEGIAVAFDFTRGRAANRLMADIDALTIEARGKPNLLKDSRLPADVVRACYPGLDDFRAALRRFDPHRRIRSSLSDRLGL